MFYGDETLKSLISHGSGLIEKIKEFDYIILEDPEEPEATDD